MKILETPSIRSTSPMSTKENRTQYECQRVIIFSPEIEYLGYQLFKGGIKSVQKKVQAILYLQPPTTLKSLRSFLGMVHFYIDTWNRRSHVVALSTDLVGKGKRKLE